MTRDMAKKIIEEEKLFDYYFFENPGTADAVVIYQKDDKWIVYVTDERAAKYPGSDFVYDNEEDALDDFINRLRGINKMVMERNKKNGWI